MIVRPPLPVIAVTGLKAEARIAEGAGVLTVAGGGDHARLSLLLQAAIERGAKAVISFGIAGGLAPGLRPGATIIATSVDDGSAVIEPDGEWRDRLAALLPHAVVGGLAGSNTAVCDVADKATLHRRTGALGVDMESHVAARLAARHGVPFAALRVVADPCERALPRAAAVGMRPDGSTDVGAVLRALARRPSDLGGLLRTALDAHAAFAALAMNRQRLCSLFGFRSAGPPEVGSSVVPDNEMSLPLPAELV